MERSVQTMLISASTLSTSTSHVLRTPAQNQQHVPPFDAHSWLLQQTTPSPTQTTAVTDLDSPTMAAPTIPGCCCAAVRCHCFRLSAPRTSLISATGVANVAGNSTQPCQAAGFTHNSIAEAQTSAVVSTPVVPAPTHTVLVSNISPAWAIMLLVWTPSQATATQQAGSNIAALKQKQPPQHKQPRPHTKEDKCV
jgi:hypothetical protein